MLDYQGRFPTCIPILPHQYTIVLHKALAEVSELETYRNGSWMEWQSESTDGLKSGGSYALWNGYNGWSGHVVGHLVHNSWM